MSEWIHAESLVVILGILTSLYVWGLLRTALWIVPNLFIHGGLWITTISLLSFFSVMAWMAPHQKQAFDLRDFSKERWTLTFFLSGVLAGALAYPPQVLSMVLGALIPLLICRLLIIFRLPPSRVLFMGRYWKWILAAMTMGLIVFRLAEVHGLWNFSQ